MPEIIPALARERLTRRAFLTLTAATAAGLSSRSPVAAEPSGIPLAVTGADRPGLEPFDRLVASFIAEHKVPGAALAVTRNAKLVYARGFGYADREQQEPVQPEALFRIASVSKPITAVAVMQLIEWGKLQLDDRVLDRMNLTPFRVAGADPDPRWKQITVRHCLQHTGGWDRKQSYDPIGKVWDIARALGIRPPVTPVDIVRYMMGQPLDFAPGERHAYSNLGYLVLGRIIEAVTGAKYEAYVKRQVLAPLGIKTAQLGRALVEHRARGEVRYYDAKNRRGPCLFPPRLGEQVPIQYGAENLDGFEAHGGWIASAVELAKFATAFDDPMNCPLLGPRTIEAMWARPEGAAGREPDGTLKAAFYGCGWSVRPVGKTGKANTWHTGLIAGTAALLVRRWDGLNWAILFNTDSKAGSESAPDPAVGKPLGGLIDGPLHDAANQVQAWPNDDLFGKYLGSPS